MSFRKYVFHESQRDPAINLGSTYLAAKDYIEELEDRIDFVRREAFREAMKELKELRAENALLVSENERLLNHYVTDRIANAESKEKL